MSALDTAKEIGRMAATATLSKDVIDLFEKKVGLLTEQVTTLETENANLKKKVENLEQENERLRPKGNTLDEVEVKFLKLLAQHGALGIEQVSGMLGISWVKSEYHRDVLANADLIRTPPIVQIGYESYLLSPKGREYLAQQGHI